MKITLTRQYVVTVRSGKDKFEKQVYTDKLVEDGKIYTYRPDGTLCLKKEFNQRGQYIMTKYNASGKTEEYHTIGGQPDKGTEKMFCRCQKSNPFCRRLLNVMQNQRGG